ncbi:MAG: acyl-CoA thioesterase [Propionibacteriales bacterium]|nr:acyl-CoA thioesterase [Propionibacteriales bacterium]
MSDRPAPSRRSDFSVRYPISTRWDDEDVYGHVNNVVYYSYFDTAVNGWLMQSSGTDIRRLPAVGLVAETGCVFHRELGFPDPVEVGIAVERLGERSIVYRLAVFQGRSDEAAADGRFVHVYVDRDSREVVDVPAQIRVTLAALQT